VILDVQKELDRRISDNNFKGIRLDRGRWRVSIMVGGVRNEYGSYKSKHDAVRARINAEIECSVFKERKSEYKYGIIRHPQKPSQIRIIQNDRKNALKALNEFNNGKCLIECAVSNKLSVIWLSSFIRYRKCRKKIIQAYRITDKKKAYAINSRPYLYSSNDAIEFEITAAKAEIAKQMI
jgi:hypothetical protein